MLIQDKHCGAKKWDQNPYFQLIFQDYELTDKSIEQYPLATDKVVPVIIPL
jgi:hypothetical protein